LSDKARATVLDQIVGLEATSGAELVVTVAVRSGHYRHADYLVGALLSLAALLFYLFYPDPLFDDVAVMLIIASFGVGTILGASLSPLRRVFVSRKQMDEEVRKAAHSKFVEQGISRTRDRTGILVYVSLFEQRVEVVPDIGIPVQDLGERWASGTKALDISAKNGFAAFAQALAAMGPMLTEAVPRAPDDINELPDDMVQA
jgi:putative membrane protein